MLLCIWEQVIEVLVKPIRLDVHANADLLVAGWHGLIEPEQAQQVEGAGEFCRKLLDDNPARHGIQNEGGRHTAGEGVQQELARVCALRYSRVGRAARRW